MTMYDDEKFPKGLKTMKKTAKSLIALSAAALMLSASGCADTSWSFKTKYETLSNGAYIYYTYAAYSDAYSKITDYDTYILDQKIEDTDATEWIANRAKEECVAHLTMSRLINEKKIKLTDSDLEAYEGYAESIYSYYFESAFEQLGVSKETYKKCSGTYSAYSEALFKSIYDIGGTSEVSQEDLEKYFTENYTDYYYFSLPLTETDDSNNTVDISDEDKEIITSRFKNYVELINTDGKTKDDVLEKYQSDYSTDQDPGTSSTAILSESGLPEDLQNAIKELEEGKATCLEVNSSYYFVYKGKIADKLSTIASGSEESEVVQNRLAVLHKMKNDEYQNYLDEEAKKTKYETNDACLSKYSVKRAVDIINSLG